MAGLSIGSLATEPVAGRIELVAAPVADALRAAGLLDEVGVVEIDPDLADTAALTEAFSISLDVSANCVLIAGKRGGEEKIAACVILASTKADVNGTAKKRLDVRKASFLGMDRAVEGSGMEYGGITPIGLPAAWPVFVDSAVASTDLIVMGSGLRQSKLILPGALLAKFPGVEIVDGLGI